MSKALESKSHKDCCLFVKQINSLEICILHRGASLAMTEQSLNTRKHLHSLWPSVRTWECCVIDWLKLLLSVALPVAALMESPLRHRASNKMSFCIINYSDRTFLIDCCRSCAIFCFSSSCVAHWLRSLWKVLCAKSNSSPITLDLLSL